MTKTRQWTVATVVAVLLVFAAGWLLLVKPQRSHAADLRSQAVSQQQANQLLQTQIASLLQEQKSLPEQQRILQKFTTQVPDNADEPGLIRQFSAAANGSGVDLVSLTPGTSTVLSGAAAAGTTLTTPPAAAATAQLTELPVALAISGSYANIESFFQAVEKLPRATLVTGWTLGSATTTGSAPTTGTASSSADVPAGTLSGTLSANVFFSAPAATTTTTPGTTPATAAPAPTQ
jgi:Tfp pilus assembly protein PilO